MKFNLKLGVSQPGWLPFIDRGWQILDLTDLNDGGMPFSQIADVIEYFFLEPE